MARQKQETKRIAVNVSMQMLDKIEQLQEHLGYRTVTAVLEHCINTTYKKELDNYVQVSKQRQPRANLTPEERAKNSAIKYSEREDARNKIRHEEGVAICDALDGEISEDGGHTYCTWNVYQKETPREVSVASFTKSLLDLDESHVENQYRGGTKKELEEIMKKYGR